MPGKVGVKIKAGRNLPVMDRSSDTTDAFVEIKLGSTTHKTDVCRKSLNPQFNTDWFRFEVDDAELQDEILQIRLMDHDTYSANDAIGKVNISLNPLCLDTAGQTANGKGTVLSGWIPVFDTMHGIRGEVNVIVKVDLFSDLNKFRQSSCGIPFFHSPCVPFGYRAQIIHGFVEELVVNDDPEYQWIDKIRTPRASNEARQAVFLQLSGQVQRKMGLKAINMGANAVIGYTQCFDLEGDVGVVVRGIGTAVTLIKDVSSNQPMMAPTSDNAFIEERSRQEYLSFLMCSSENPYPTASLSPSEAFKCEIQKSHSMAVTDLKQNESSLDTEDDTAEIMLSLMRQEDERGEKPVPKLKQQMRKFTRSSRNLFNEKYNAIKRKMGEDSFSPDSMSMRSFGSFMSAASLAGNFGKSESSSSPQGSQTIYFEQPHRHSFKAKRRSSPKWKSKGKTAAKQLTAPHPPHHMVRSISDDTAVRSKADEVQSKGNVPTIAVSADDYQDSSRSSPNICRDAHIDTNHLYACLPDDLPATIERFADAAGFESSSTLSLSVSESSSTSSSNDDENYELAYAANERWRGSKPKSMQERKEAAQKLAHFLKIIDEEESGQEKWMKPGETNDDSFPELTAKSPQSFSRSTTNLLSDFKSFSQHLQALLKPKKSSQKPTPTSTPSSMRRRLKTPPNKLLLSPLTEQHRKSFYASQPEIFVENLTNDASQQLAPATAPITHSRSMLNLQNLVPFTTAAATESPALHLCLPEKSSKNSKNSKICTPPILQICPSTPTPTPSPTDSDISQQLTPIDDGEHVDVDVGSSIIAPSNNSTADIVRSLVIESQADKRSSSLRRKFLPETNNSLPIDKSAHQLSHENMPSPSSSSCLSSSFSRSCTLAPNSRHLSKINAKTKPTIEKIDHNVDNNQNSLLAPASISIQTNVTNASSLPLPMSSSSQSSTLAPAAAATTIERSLNENGATNGSTNDSPSMKRFASPASAAIVAAASHNNTAAMPATTTQPQTATATTATTTASTATPMADNSTSTTQLNNRAKLTPSPSTKMGLASPGDNISATTTASTSTTTSAATMIPKDVGEICRRSSDSDLSVTPKGNSICVASERLVAATAMMRLSQPISAKSSTGGPTADSMDSMLEYPFLTMTKYPNGFILHLGATVAARSVKLLERVPNPDEPEVRDSWWTELRMEIRSHARALGCNVVLGYSESTTISDDVCVLSATGTAAVINMAYNRSVSQQDIYTTAATVITAATAAMKAGNVGGGGMSTSLEERDMLKETRNGFANIADGKGMMSSSFGGSGGNLGSAGKKLTTPFSLGNKPTANCTICHVPYNLATVPFNVKMKKCATCRKGRVPDVLLATLEVPDFVQVTGRGCFMQAQVVRSKKDLRSELNAKEISDGLPFLEYELHRVLINKLKAKGMNAIFGLRTQVSIGERVIALVATGTALFLTALPVPLVPRIVAGNSWTDKQKLNELQKKLQETYERNQRIYQLKCFDPDMDTTGNGTTNELAAGQQKQQQSDTDESDDEVIEIDVNCGNKDACVLEVDDIEDLEIISLLMEPYPPEGFHVVNTQTVPGMVDMEGAKNLQMFTQIWRAKLDVGQQTINGFPKHFQRILQTIYFKLRTMIPCAICDLRFRLDLPESDQIQLLVTGMALGLGDGNRTKQQQRRKQLSSSAGPSTNNLKLKTTQTQNGNDSGSSGNSQAETNGTPATTTQVTCGAGNKRPLQEEDYIFPLDEDQMIETPTPTSNLPPYGQSSFKLRKTSPSRITSLASASFKNRYFPLRDRHGIDITPLSFIPGGRIEKYLGNLNFFFIRESTSIRESGGISGFVHSFVTELLAVVRAHIAALGGNAMVSFYMNELILVDNSQHKNQGQCLISIGGDAVNVSYFTDE